MDSDEVYRVLLDVFPQVDRRALRAVAYAHSNDADLAVEAVLVEVLPFLSEDIAESSSSNVKGSSSEGDIQLGGRPASPPRAKPGFMFSLNDSSGESEDEEATPLLKGKSKARSSGSPRSHSLENTKVSGGAIFSGKENSDDYDYHELVSSVSGSVRHDQSLSATSPREGKAEGKAKASSDESLRSHPLERRKVDDSALLSDWAVSDGYHELQSFVSGSIRDDQFQSETSTREGMKSEARTDEPSLLHSLENREVAACTTLSYLVDSDKPLLSAGAIHGEQVFVNDVAIHGEQVCVNDVRPEAASAVQERMELSQESSSQLVAEPDSQATVVDEQDSSTIIVSSNNDVSSCGIDELQDESTMNTMVSRSDYVCNMDFLEDLIEDARKNKKTLVSAMDSVISLAREVEFEEKAAEEAKVEATSGCADIQKKVHDLKLALQRAKEANDMHAGEVYAEKAVLTTEAKELQSRLLSLSDERDRSLQILAEMRESLEVRLNSAQKEVEEALRLKLENEESALEALALQERIMDEVVQESKLLKQEAEENSKLQDFLMDRGRIVDMLQGEISVKCQDVMLLKEKIDNRVPLSTSLFSSQTHLLGSSSSRSSSRSMSPTTPVLKLGGSNDKLEKSEEFVDSFDSLQNNIEQDLYKTQTQTMEQGQGARVANFSETMKLGFIHNEHHSTGETDDSKVPVEDGWDFL